MSIEQVWKLLLDKKDRLVMAAVGIGLAVGLTACSRPTPDSEIKAATLHLDLQSCTVGITNRASAVVVREGLIVTVAHSFEETESFTILDSKGQVVAAHLVYLDSERDIAVLELDGPAEGDSGPTGLSFGEPNDDTTVRFASFATTDTEGPTIRDATIVRYTRLTLDGVGNRAGIELLAPIDSGDSGGPVLSDQGEILGLVFATSNGSEKGWAIAAEEVLTAIERATEGHHQVVPLGCG